MQLLNADGTRIEARPLENFEGKEGSQFSPYSPHISRRLCLVLVRQVVIYTFFPRLLKALHGTDR